MTCIAKREGVLELVRGFSDTLMASGTGMVIEDLASRAAAMHCDHAFLQPGARRTTAWAESLPPLLQSARNLASTLRREKRKIVPADMLFKRVRECENLWRKGVYDTAQPVVAEIVKWVTRVADLYSFPGRQRAWTSPWMRWTRWNKERGNVSRVPERTPARPKALSRNSAPRTRSGCRRHPNCRQVCRQRSPPT